MRPRHNVASLQVQEAADTAQGAAAEASAQVGVIEEGSAAHIIIP